MFYEIENNSKQEKFSTFMNAFKCQQKFYKKSKIYCIDSEKKIKVWDPIWEIINFYNDEQTPRIKRK